MKKLSEIYRKLVIDQPLPILLIILITSAFFGYNTRHFSLDASADSLLLEDDADLRYYQKVKRSFASEVADEADEYLVLTYQPQADLFDDASLSALRLLVDDLGALEGVVAVRSILDVPLFQSPKLNLMQIAASVVSGLPTLDHPRTDRSLARKELSESPYAKNLVISGDGSLTALMVIFSRDPEFQDLRRRREDYQIKKYETVLTAAEHVELAQLEQEYRLAKQRSASKQASRVATVRELMQKHRQKATLFLGGVPMIVADMITFVQADLLHFGLGVMAFLVLTLGIIFRRPRWVILPLLTCIITVLIMIGFLGLVEWPATVISSNFTSLLFIITMSMAIHIVVRYRELSAKDPEARHADLVFQASCLVARPCLFCALTTIVGFGSLMVSGIQPVIDFGRMMSLGIGVAYVICFSFFPAALALLPKERARETGSDQARLTLFFERLVQNHGKLTLLIAALIVAIGIWGITRLTVENRFVDYFKSNTDIYKGMVVIDSRLGGTTPLEIVLSGSGKNYWFQAENLSKLRAVHRFLEQQSEIGKVISLDTLIQVGESINDGKPLNPFLLNMLRGMLPANLKAQLLAPFVNDDSTKVRLVALIRETDPNLKRQVLLAKINDFLYQDKGFDREGARITGLYVLYNNLLQSLFKSQILTIGLVFMAVWLMFILLFRSITLATISLVPNLFPVVFVLGCLGLLGIPLDIMTITIAAITIGIAVDQTIHYVHRFKTEFPKTGNYNQTMMACHRSIGRAMYYTSVTIIAGFSILVFSNFMPTIYFGLFTSMAMLAALFGSLSLLPALIILLKPLGAQRSDA